MLTHTGVWLPTVGMQAPTNYPYGYVAMYSTSRHTSHMPMVHQYILCELMVGTVLPTHAIHIDMWLTVPDTCCISLCMPTVPILDRNISYMLLWTKFSLSMGPHTGYQVHAYSTHCTVGPSTNDLPLCDTWPMATLYLLRGLRHCWQLAFHFSVARSDVTTGNLQFNLQ